MSSLVEIDFVIVNEVQLHLMVISLTGCQFCQLSPE